MWILEVLTGFFSRSEKKALPNPVEGTKDESKVEPLSAAPEMTPSKTSAEPMHPGTRRFLAAHRLRGRI